DHESLRPAWLAGIEGRPAPSPSSPVLFLCSFRPAGQLQARRLRPGIRPMPQPMVSTFACFHLSKKGGLCLPVQEMTTRGFESYQQLEGRITWTAVPLLTTLSISILPPCASTMLLQMDSPSPVPPPGLERATSTR